MKKILALLMAVCLMLTLLAGCSSTPAEPVQGTAEPGTEQPAAEPGAEKETVTLKVWADQVELELAEKLCIDFPQQVRLRHQLVYDHKLYLFSVLFSSFQHISSPSSILPYQP